MNRQSNIRRLIAVPALLLSLNLPAAQNVVKDTTGFSSNSVGNVLEMLSGRVPGVRISSIDGNVVGGMNVNIRGLNSLRTDNQPLVVVDGMTVSTNLSENLVAFPQMGEESYLSSLNPLAFLAPNDIESIEVLKDVSATAIYGVKGANGVIIINTKRSAEGGRNIRVSSNIGLNTRINHNHYVAFQGKERNTGYNISATFRSLAANIPRTGSNYGSLKANFETHAGKNVAFGLNALMGIGSVSSTSGVAYLGQPSYTVALRDADTGAMSDWLEDYDDDSRDYRALASTFFQLNIIPSLHFRIEGGVDFQSNQRIVWYGRKTQFGAPSPSNELGGRASNLFSQLLNFNAKASFGFDKFFATVHHLKLLALFDVQGNNDKFNVMCGQSFLYDNLRGKGLNTGNFVPFLCKNYGEYLHIGGHVSASYDYDDIFGADIAFRVDHTPKYMKNATNLYPSASAWLNLHRAFFSDCTSVSALRIEGGYGVSGREKMVPYNLFGNFLTGSWYEPEPTTEPFYDGLVNLRTAEWHIGASVGFLSDRLNIGATYYDRSTSDTFTMYQMGTYDMRDEMWTFGPNTNFSGCDNVFSRESSLRNRGFELELDTDIIRTRNWRWTLDANVSYNSNVITSSNVEDFPGKAVGQGIYATCNVYSRPVSCFYGFLADEDGNFVDITGEGVIGNEDRTLLGNSAPLYHGGVQSVLKWKSLSFEVALDGAAGHKIANVNALVKDGKRGPDGLIALSSNYLEKGDYLRINQVGIKYDFNTGVQWLRQLGVRFTCRNLFTFTSYSGLNPDVNSFGVSTLSNGLDYGSYPVNRLFLLGIDLKF